MHATANNNNNKFRDAEQMWFWFVSSKRIQDGLRRAGASSFRPCELIDIETLTTRLHLSGRITREQLEIMVRFGERRRAPTQHIYAENRAAMLWQSAMCTMQLAASAKGWLE